MSRRVSLPGADELFRSTKVDESDEPGQESPPAEIAPQVEDGAAAAAKPASSGRVRHDEKITVYVTADELIRLEHTRLRLRSEHRLAVDRGRIVREAIHLALEGVETDGDMSPLVQRLREQ